MNLFLVYAIFFLYSHSKIPHMALNIFVIDVVFIIGVFKNVSVFICALLEPI